MITGKKGSGTDKAKGQHKRNVENEPKLLKEAPIIKTPKGKTKKSSCSRSKTSSQGRPYLEHTAYSEPLAKISQELNLSKGKVNKKINEYKTFKGFWVNTNSSYKKALREFQAKREKEN